MSLSRERTRLLRRLATRKGREGAAMVVVEGPRAVRAALEAGARISFLVVEEGVAEEEGDPAVLLDEARGAGTEIHAVSARRFRELAGTEAPQGILAVAHEPRPELPDPDDPAAERPAAGERCLVLDRVRDPGNAGTLIRAAAAFGLARVLVLDGTVDPWNGKAVRASAGLAFRIPVHRVPWPEGREWLRGAELPLLVADARGRDVRTVVREGGLGAAWALLLGNEAAGPRPEALEAAAAPVAVPLAPGVESLNVAMAGTVLMWALGPGRPEGDRASEEAP